jgi:hypothetical protein
MPQATIPDAPPRLSVVLPCLDEEEIIEEVVRNAIAGIERCGRAGEVIVVDNGSSDRSAELARRAGATVISEPLRGYGSALRAGFGQARGDYVVMADADLSYDLDEIPRFLSELDAGADVVIGNRLANLRPDAMPWSHRRIGNPALTGALNLLFDSDVADAHCGLRAFRRDVLPVLDLRTNGMELASEMVIRAARSTLDVRQLDIDYRPRGGTSKLKRYRDGWRHLRFLLVHSPTYLFLAPGGALLIAGALTMAVVLSRLDVLGREWDVHTLIAGSLACIVGTQIIALGLVAHTYGNYFLGASERWFERGRARFRLEHGLLLGAAIALPGAVAAIVVVWRWVDRGFGGLAEVRPAMLAATLLVVGVQVFFTSFVLSILGLRGPERSAMHRR